MQDRAELQGRVIWNGPQGEVTEWIDHITIAYSHHHELSLYRLENASEAEKAALAAGEEVDESCTFTPVDTKASTATSNKRKIAKDVGGRK